MNSHEFFQFPSLEHILAALPAGAVVSPSVVPLAAVASGVGSPVPAAVFVASLPTGVRVFRCRVCPWPCSCGKPSSCRCPSLAVVLSGSASPSCVLVWLAAPLPPPPPGCGPALAAVRAAVASRPSSVHVAVIGSRGFPALSLVSDFVAALPAGVAVVSGAAAGADREALDTARERSLPVVSRPAAWSRFGRRAGVMRNAEVVKVADLLVAFWDGVSAGTQDAIRRARKEGIPVFVISPPPVPDAPAQPSLF